MDAQNIRLGRTTPSRGEFFLRPWLRQEPRKEMVKMSNKASKSSGRSSKNGSSTVKLKPYSFDVMLQHLTFTCEGLREMPVDVKSANATCNCIGKMLSVVNTARRLSKSELDLSANGLQISRQLPQGVK